ncbi:MAG TPA: AEC family transporter [Halanaerobiales bacterium]|nr:AEC family transporter [Halanaerobiales bacterium]
MVFINALQSVFSILIMISIGCILTARKWFDEELARLFSRIIINITLPALMVHNMVTSFTGDELLALLGGLRIPFITILVSYLISISVSHVFDIPRNRRGLFRTMFAFSNTIFIGLPVNIALFGEISVPYVTLFYIANTTLFWTLGIYEIRRDDGAVEGIFSMETVKRIFSPILMAFIISVILVLVGFKLPNFILDTLKYMSNLTTPLSMLTIGIIIYQIRPDEFKINRDLILILLGRFLLSPLIAYSVFKLFGGSFLMLKVFVIEAAMPVMTTIAIVGHAYNADHRYASVMVTISTIISLIMIPIYMYLLG